MCWKCPPWASKHNWTRRCIFPKVGARTWGDTACISRWMFSRKSSSVRGLFMYTRPLRWPHRKKSGGVKSGELGGHSPNIDTCSALARLVTNTHFRRLTQRASSRRDTTAIVVSPLPLTVKCHDVALFPFSCTTEHSVKRSTQFSKFYQN
jgi:hypothetical protein